MRHRLIAPLASLALVVLLLIPGTLSAAPLAIDAGFINSRLNYGGPAFFHEGYDLYRLSLSGLEVSDDWNVDESDTFFEASGGALVQHTLTTDVGGNVVRSLYRYEGGLFRIDFSLVHNASGNVRTGVFTAPIDWLEINASEPPNSGGYMAYRLGPGLFDPAFAAAVGIIEKTGTAFVDAYLLNPDRDDHTSDDRFAEDGLTEMGVGPHVPVPEPALSALLATGATAVAGTRVRRRFRR